MQKYIGLILISTLILALALLFWLLPTPSTKQLQTANNIDELFVREVRLIINGTLSSPKTLHIKNGIIHNILEPSHNTQNHQNTIEAKGKIAIPGLIDAHTHSYGTALHDALRFGVTTQLDMFSDVRSLQQAHQPETQADFFSAGMLATAPGGHGTQFGVPIMPISHESEAKEWVQQRKKEGSHYIKIVYHPKNSYFPSISLGIAKALIKEAHAAELLALAHIETEQAAHELIEAGIDGLVHIFTDKSASQNTIALAKKHNVFIIPTLSVMGDAQLIRAGVENLTAQQPTLSPNQKQSIFTDFPASFKSKQRYKFGLENTLAFHQAGVPILAGSDAPNPTTAHGISLHFELQHLVKAGLTPAQALDSATKQTAFSFALKNIGQLAIGKQANILLGTSINSINL